MLMLLSLRLPPHCKLSLVDVVLAAVLASFAHKRGDADSVLRQQVPNISDYAHVYLYEVADLLLLSVKPECNACSLAGQTVPTTDNVCASSRACLSVCLSVCLSHLCLGCVGFTPEPQGLRVCVYERALAY